MAIDALSERAEKEIVSGGSNEKNLIGYVQIFSQKFLDSLICYRRLMAFGIL